MLGRRNKEKEVDYKSLNEVIGLSKNILKIAYILIAIIGIYAITMIFKEWNVKSFLFTILGVVSPLFVGLLIAWLFHPFVSFLQQKGIHRGLGAFITYVLFLGALAIVIGAIIPILSQQINDFVNMLPSIFDNIKGWLDGVFDQLDHIENFDAIAMKKDIFSQINEFGIGLTKDLPNITIDVVQSIFSGIGIFVIGLIIGFYLLVSFDGVHDMLMVFIPPRIQSDTKELLSRMNESMRNFVQGALLDCTFIFIITTFFLWIVGLKGFVLFGLFCGITNIIPYAGPYIGGAPAVIVGFSQSPTIGLLTLLVIVVIQFLEGNFLQPLIMSRTTKLHPVTIMLGLLIFGHFWGIVGMVVSTPIISAVKSFFQFFDDKYNILNSEEE